MLMLIRNIWGVTKLTKSMALTLKCYIHHLLKIEYSLFYKIIAWSLFFSLSPVWFTGMLDFWHRVLLSKSENNTTRYREHVPNRLIKFKQTYIVKSQLLVSGYKFKKCNKLSK